MKKMWGFLAILVMALLILPAALACGGAGGQTSKETLPNIITMTTYSSGSKSYLIAAAMAAGIEKSTGVKTRVVPGGTNKARAMMVATGEAQLGIFSDSELYQAEGGIWAWLEDGPTYFALVWAGPGDMGLVARGDAGIKGWADLKGKKVASFEKHDLSYHTSMRAYLAFGGLTYADVIPYYVPNTSAGNQALIDGACDVTPSTATSPAVFELASSARGAFFFQFPADNVEGWKRLRAIEPLRFPKLMTEGPGITKDKPLWNPGVYFPMLARLDTSESLIYAAAKALYQEYDSYKGVHVEAPDWYTSYFLDPKKMIVAPAPMHPGAIKFFKEKGLWTAWHDKWQASRMAFVSKAKQSYQETVDLGLTQKPPVDARSAAFAKAWEPKWQKLWLDELNKEF